MTARVLGEHRPHRRLLVYYVLTALVTGPAALIVLPVLFFRYHTLVYRFDAEGVSQKVGILFRREVNLTYARIQDIHLTSNIVQRWLGLADLRVQTAAGSAEAELVVEGLTDFEAVRDFLYGRMRGATAHHEQAHAEAASDETAVLLREIRDALRLTREALERPRG